MTKQQIVDEVRKLPHDERLDLVFDLWGMIEGEDLDISQEFQDELDVRLAEDKADQRPGEDWNVLRAKLLRGEI